MSLVNLGRDGRVLVLEMNRPERGNRVTADMGRELVEALEAARRDPGVAACVLTGAADAFCLGGDYDSAGPVVTERLEFARAFIDATQAMHRLGKPLVAAVNGNAHAGGFTLVLSADLAVAAEGITLGLPEAAHGLFPIIALAVVRDQLPKKVLFDIVYRARLLSAAEARDLHLVNEIVAAGEVLARAVALAEQAAAYNPAIVMLGRDLYYSQRGMSPTEALEQSRFALAAALGARDQG